MVQVAGKSLKLVYPGAKITGANLMLLHVLSWEEKIYPRPFIYSSGESEPRDELMVNEEETTVAEIRKGRTRIIAVAYRRSD